MLQSSLIQAASLTPDQIRLLAPMIMFIGLILIVASSMNFMYGYAGIPFLGNAVPAYLGGVTVSAVTTRLAYIIAEAGGIRLLPLGIDNDWMFNSEQNAKLVNGLLESNPALCIGLIVLTLLLAMVFGAIGGWLIGRPALRLKPTYLMMTSLILVLTVDFFSRNILALSGGTMGIFVPDLFAFYKGDRIIPSAILDFLIITGVFLLLRAAKNLPDVRLLRAIHEKELPDSSSGDIVSLRGRVILLSSGLIALAGALNSIFYLFVAEGNFANSFWMNIPLFMIIVGGLGSHLGSITGVALITALRYGIILHIETLGATVFFPVSFLDDLVFILIIFTFLILVPNGIFHRRTPLKPMVGYVEPSRRRRYDGLKAKYIPTTIKVDAY